MFHFSLGWTSLVNRFLGPKQAQKVLLGLADPNLHVSPLEVALPLSALFYLDENTLFFTLCQSYLHASCYHSLDPLCKIFLVRVVFIELYSGLGWN